MAALETPRYAKYDAPAQKTVAGQKCIADVADPVSVLFLFRPCWNEGSQTR